MIRYVDSKDKTDSYSNYTKKMLLKRLMYASGLYFDIMAEEVRHKDTFQKKYDNLDIIVYRDELAYAKKALFDLKPCIYYKRKFLIFREKILNYPPMLDSLKKEDQELEIYYEYGTTGVWIVDKLKNAVMYPNARWLFLDNYRNITALCFDVAI